MSKSIGNVIGRMQGKVAIVTGAASGIGLSTAKRFAIEGASVVMVDVSEQSGKKEAESIRANGGECEFVCADMRSHEDVRRMVKHTIERYGKLDAAFNNAGVPGQCTNVVDCSEDDWDFVSDVNLKGVWLCMKYQIPHMIDNGGGAIVNTASEAANSPAPNMASYVATKAGVIGLTRSAALDFASKNVRVNALVVGPTRTPMLTWGESEAGLNADFRNSLPMGRVGRAEEQSDAVLWMCSDESSFVTGAKVNVDGGLSLT